MEPFRIDQNYEPELPGEVELSGVGPVDELHRFVRKIIFAPFLKSAAAGEGKQEVGPSVQFSFPNVLLQGQKEWIRKIKHNSADKSSSEYKEVE